MQFKSVICVCNCMSLEIKKEGERKEKRDAAGAEGVVERRQRENSCLNLSTAIGQTDPDSTRCIWRCGSLFLSFIDIKCITQFFFILAFTKLSLDIKCSPPPCVGNYIVAKYAHPQSILFFTVVLLYGFKQLSSGLFFKIVLLFLEAYFIKKTDE